MSRKTNGKAKRELIRHRRYKIDYANRPERDAEWLVDFLNESKRRDKVEREKKYGPYVKVVESLVDDLSDGATKVVRGIEMELWDSERNWCEELYSREYVFVDRAVELRNLFLNMKRATYPCCMLVDFSWTRKYDEENFWFCERNDGDGKVFLGSFENADEAIAAAKKFFVGDRKNLNDLPDWINLYSFTGSNPCVLDESCFDENRLNLDEVERAKRITK